VGGGLAVAAEQVRGDGSDVGRGDGRKSKVRGDEPASATRGLERLRLSGGTAICLADTLNGQREIEIGCI